MWRPDSGHGVTGLLSLSGAPPVGVTDFDHGAEDGVPCFLLHEDAVGEHAAVPADVLHAAIRRAFEPVAGGFGNIEFAVWIVGLAVAAGFVVAAGPVNGAVVLRNVEVERPRAQGIGHGGVG